MKLELTDSAITYLNTIRKDNCIDLSIKTSSGCAGFVYSLELSPLEKSNYKFNDIPFYIPEDSIDGLNNCMIDFIKNGLTSKLEYVNPNVISQCGCGVSFNLNK